MDERNERKPGKNLVAVDALGSLFGRRRFGAAEAHPGGFRRRDARWRPLRPDSWAGPAPPSVIVS